MRAKDLLPFLSLFFTLQVNAQTAIQGQVTDAATGMPLPAVSIYINNSAVGTTTNGHGTYTLNNVTARRFDLIISCIGYQTISKPLSLVNIPPQLNFKLKAVSKELQAVIIQADDKNGWSKWGQLFTDNLLGKGVGSEKCRILNKKAVKFKFNKEEEKLNVYAFEPLIIENKYLGYMLIYDMQFFKYDFKAHSIFFLGYPLFKLIQGSDKENIKWQQNRKYAYEGSMLHFMRALYRNRLNTEGFALNKVTRKPNTEKMVQTQNMRTPNGEVMVSLPDSSNYSGRTLLLLDSIDYISNTPLVRDSVAYVSDSVTVVLKFAGHIQVKYAKEKDMGAEDKFHEGFIKGKPTSMITLLSNAILVYKNGTYYEPDEIFIEGYWSRIEKLCNLLPINYGE